MLKDNNFPESGTFIARTTNHVVLKHLFRIIFPHKLPRGTSPFSQLFFCRSKPSGESSRL